MCHTQKKMCTQEVVAGDCPVPGGAHCCSIHSSLLLITTATTVIIIKEIFCIQIREATWGGKMDILDGIGKIGLNLLVFVLLQSSEANT